MLTRGGLFVAARPEHMPKDSYFNTHEIDPIAAQVISHCKCTHSTNSHSSVTLYSVMFSQSHFRARTRNWMFAVWRDDDIAALDVDKSNSEGSDCGGS